MGLLRRQQLGLDLFVSEVGVHQKDTEGGQESFGQVKEPPQKRRGVIRVESAETQDYVSPLPLTGHLDQKKGGGGREEHGGAEFRSECSQ